MNLWLIKEYFFNNYFDFFEIKAATPGTAG